MQAFKAMRKSPDQMLSQTLWGGAGMLARGYVYKLGNPPHPLRKRLFQSAKLIVTKENSFDKVDNLIKTKRTAYRASYLTDDEQQHFLNINIPPIPIRVIQESNSHIDLLKVALQMREEYTDLRLWLRSYHEMITENSKDRVKFDKTIKSIDKYIDSHLGITQSDSATFSAGLGIFKIAIKGQPINHIANQFGIRATVNNLILEDRNSSALEKFLSLFDHQKSQLGFQISEHFSTKHKPQMD